MIKLEVNVTRKISYFLPLFNCFRRLYTLITSLGFLGASSIFEANKRQAMTVC